MKQSGAQFDAMVRDTFHILNNLTQTKGEEYTGRRQTDNQHDNFDRAAIKLGMLPEQILAVYLGKHLDSIETYINDLAFPGRAGNYSEPISGRIDDAILYLLLLKGMVWRQEHGTRADNEQARPIVQQGRRAGDKKEPLPPPGKSLEEQAARVLGATGLDLGHRPGPASAAGKDGEAGARVNSRSSDAAP